MKSEALASAWLSPATTSAPALPYVPCSSLALSFTLAPAKRDQMSTLANPTGPQQAPWASLHSPQPAQSPALHPRNPGAKASSSQVGQIQPALQRAGHDILVSSGLLRPEVPTPCLVVLSSALIRLTPHLLFPLLWAHPTTAVTQNQGMCLPNSGQAVSLEKAV